MSNETEYEQVGHVFGALAAVKDEINSVGVAKARDNRNQGYKFRGVDDALNAFSGPLARNKILVTPSYDKAEISDIGTRNGTSMRFAYVRGTFQFLSLVDGSSIIVGPFEGEASDTLDKALSKACSVAMRNMLFLTFTVPFMGEEDPDSTEHADAADGDPDKVEPVRSPAGGERKIDVSVSQGKLLDAKLAAFGRDRDWIMDDFGAVTGATFKAAMAHIEKHGPSQQ